jgi:hypothetical protein
VLVVVVMVETVFGWLLMYDIDDTGVDIGDIVVEDILYTASASQDTHAY